MATLKIIFRSSSRGAAYPGSLCLRLIHQRRVRQLTTPLKLYQSEWDASGEAILFPETGFADKDRSPYLESVSSALDSYREVFLRITDKLSSSGCFRVDDIAAAYGFREDPSSLSSFTRYVSGQLERSGSERTARAYRTACRALVAFNKGQDMPLAHINKRLIKSYELHMKGQGKALNTISYHLRMLRAIYWRAVREKVIPGQDENPFEGVFTGFRPTRKRALNIEEMRALNNLDFSLLLEQPVGEGKLSSKALGATDMGLYTSWRLFMFCFHARGMSFVDMAYLQKLNLRGGVISYYRKKTGKKLEITLTPFLRRIIDSFASEVRDSPFLFPVIRTSGSSISTRLQYESSLRLQNNRLKRLSGLAGIRKPLSTHVSRHSWATLGKTQNLPLWVISEGLGHATEKITYTYLASFDTATLDAANEVITGAIRASVTTGTAIPTYRS